MTATQGNLAGLSRFIFQAPRWYTSAAFSVVIAAFVGVAAFDSQFLYEDLWQGIFFIGIPTVVAGVLTGPIDRTLGGSLTHNRASLLALLCELIVVAMLILTGAIAVLTPVGQIFVIDSLLIALASIFALRLLVVMAVSRHSLPIAAIPAGVQTAVAGGFLGIYSGTTGLLLENPLLMRWLSRPQEGPPELLSIGLTELGLLAIMCVVYAGAVWVFLITLDRPWRSSLGVSALDFIQGFIGHIAEGSRELEDFFEDLGESALVPVTVFSVRRVDGGEKARFVLPMIHPGPMGEIGGGNLPERIAAEAEGLGFPPHATAGHDFNLVTEREVDPILSAADTAMDRIDYTDTASASVRLSEGEATLTGQAFGEDALVTATFSPGYADDVDYAVGLSAAAEAHAADIDEVLLLDAHNCNDGLEGADLGHVVPGSQRSFDLIYGAGRLGEELSAAERQPFECGVAWDETAWGPPDGIGPLGIRVCCIAVDGQTTAYVLVDGNNMEPGLREEILSAVEGVDTVEVMTTDTHVVNTVEAVNQVGGAIETAPLIEQIQSLIDEAKADLEPCEAGMDSEKANVTVFGNDRTETLASTANAVVSMGAALAGAFILGVLALSVILFFLAGG
jgi:putative membrane protein